MSLAEQVEAFARGVANRAPEAAADALDLVGHGEWGLAFDILLTNLHEAEVLLTETELGAAEGLARALQLGGLGVACLRGLERDASGRQAAVVFTVEWVTTTRQLHELLAQALGFPGYYGHNWDAFWDAITGLVVMPHRLDIWEWPRLAERLPRDAHLLVSCMLDARSESPESAAELVLRDGDRVLDAAAERSRLQGTPR